MADGFLRECGNLNLILYAFFCLRRVTFFGPPKKVTKESGPSIAGETRAASPPEEE
jgi:hypothetical protein